MRGNVEDGVREKRELLDRFTELSMKFAEPMSDDEMNALLEEQGEVQDQIDRTDAWNLDRMLDTAMDALRLPPPDGRRHHPVRRRATARGAVPAAAVAARPAAAGRADQPPRRRLRGVAGALPEQYPGLVMAVTHDRYFLDNVAGWILELDRGRGLPFEGNYSGWLEQKQARLAVEEKQESARQRTLARELEWVRMSPPRPPGEVQGARGRVRAACSPRSRACKLDTVEIHIPAGPRLGDVVVEAEHLQKGFGDRLLIEDLTFKLPPGGIVGVIGANGAGKTTLFRMITGQETARRGRPASRRDA